MRIDLRGISKVKIQVKKIKLEWSKFQNQFVIMNRRSKYLSAIPLTKLP